MALGSVSEVSQSSETPRASMLTPVPHIGPYHFKRSYWPMFWFACNKELSGISGNDFGFYIDAVLTWHSRV